MIAANFRKYPDAMALQLVLKFGRPVWNTSRPSTRIGRALRQGQAALVKATPQIVAWVKTPTPQWFRDQARRAKALAQSVRAALGCLVWNVTAEEPAKRQAVKRTPWAIVELLDDYEDTHHGNQAHPLTGALCNRTGWYHIASGMQLAGASKREILNGWTCANC